MQTVKVSRAQLLEALKAAKVKQQADYEKALKKYNEITGPRYKERVVQALEHEADKIRSSAEYSPHYGYNYITVNIGGESPQKPATPHFAALDREIRLLEIGAEDVIAVRTDSDWAKYL